MALADIEDILAALFSFTPSLSLPFRPNPLEGSTFTFILTSFSSVTGRHEFVLRVGGVGIFH